MKTRLTPAIRREAILDAAVRVAEQSNYMRVTRDEIATAAGCSPALVSNHFGTMVQLRRTLIREAIRRKSLPIVAQGLALRDRHALSAPEELVNAALLSLK